MANIAGIAKGLVGATSTLGKLAKAKNIGRLSENLRNSSTLGKYAVSADPLTVIGKGAKTLVKTPAKLASRIGRTQVLASAGLTKAKIKKLTSGKFLNSEEELVDFISKHKLVGEREDVGNKLSALKQSSAREVTSLAASTPGVHKSRAANYVKQELAKELQALNVEKFTEIEVPNKTGYPGPKKTKTVKQIIVPDFEDSPRNIKQDQKFVNSLLTKDEYTASELLELRRSADRWLKEHKPNSKGDVRPEFKDKFDSHKLGGFQDELRSDLRNISGGKLRLLDKDVQIASEMKYLAQDTSGFDKIGSLRDFAAFGLGSHYGGGTLQGLAAVAGAKFLSHPSVSGRIGISLRKLSPKHLETLARDAQNGLVSPKGKMILQSVFNDANKDLSRAAFQFAINENRKRREELEKETDRKLKLMRSRKR